MQALGKRKRTEEEDIEKVFAKYWGELHHALKTAKGFERQRQSKRLHDRSTPQDKKARIENEIVVLKSLDLYQAAHAHLCFSLLRIKRIAECPNLPEAVKRGVSKPVLTEEERTALHNVTSALCARQEVRTVTEKAIVGICKAMGIEPPEKKGKKSKKEKDEQPKTEETKQNGDDKKTTNEKKEDEKKDTKVEKKAKEVEKKKDDKTKTKEKPAKKEAVPAAQDSDDDEVEVLKDEEEEKLLSKYDDLLGGSSSEESDADDEDDERFASKAAVKKRPIAKELDPMEITDDEEGGYGDSPELDPMEITDDEEAEDGDSEQNGEDDSEDEFEGFSDEESYSKPQPQSEDEPEEDEAEDSDSSSSGIDAAPSKKKSKTSSTASTQKLQNFTMDSTFLPTLMGGYISGSESASDVDVAPARKNRRGQRARQAIWEKKFKEEAKHLKKMQNARDAGWDMKRGAVESDGKPWKKGSVLDIKNKGKGGNEEGGDAKEGGGDPARGGDRGRGGGRGGRGGAAGRGGGRGDAAPAAPPARAPKKRDDSGPLHPSWEAKKKAKEKEKLSAPFQGKKITFD